MKKSAGSNSNNFLILIVSLLAVLGACNHSGDDRLKKHLRQSMEAYLNKTSAHSETSSFEVLEVNYYNERTNYLCEFKVKLHENGKDTIGTMAAQISHDFFTVRRTR